MNWELILTIISSIITIIAIIIGYYQNIKKKLEQEALNAINKAEELDKIGEEKMQEAIKQVSKMVPSIAKPFITDKMIEVIIQNIFNKVEDYAKKQLTKENNVK